jgi:hypothetical protein
LWSIVVVGRSVGNIVVVEIAHRRQPHHHTRLRRPSWSPGHLHPLIQVGIRPAPSSSSRELPPCPSSSRSAGGRVTQPESVCAWLGLATQPESVRAGWGGVRGVRCHVGLTRMQNKSLMGT